MHRSILIIFALLLFTACAEEKTINLTAMTGFPEDIMGCSCYFAETEADFKAQRYMYVDSYERNPAFISVNDTLIPVNVENKEDQPYEVIIDIKAETQLGSDLYHREGRMTVVHESGAVMIKTIYGECGC